MSNAKTRRLDSFGENRLTRNATLAYVYRRENKGVRRLCFGLENGSGIEDASCEYLQPMNQLISPLPVRRVNLQDFVQDPL
ncbi:MAG: hypothetical protein KDB03_00290 [Planctomycetales bacterium]|nr:hypothetical protein [Planctomycetales bacterium]